MTAHGRVVNQSTIEQGAFRCGAQVRLHGAACQASAGVRAPSGHTNAAISNHEPAINATIAATDQPSWTPSASELLALCSAIPGYSEPVRQRSRQSTNPRNPSGMRNAGCAES